MDPLDVLLEAAQGAIDKDKDSKKTDTALLHTQTGNVIVLDCERRELYYCHLGPLLPHPHAHRIRKPVARMLDTGQAYRFAAGSDEKRLWPRGSTTAEMRREPWSWASAQIATIRKQCPPGAIGKLGAGVVIRDGKPTFRTVHDSPSGVVRSHF